MNERKNKTYPSSHENDDPFVDSLLEEWLGKAEQPRINLNRLLEHKLAPEDILRFDAAVELAQSEIDQLEDSFCSRPQNSSFQVGQNRSKPISHSFQIRWFAAMAAVLMIAIGASLLALRDSSNGQRASNPSRDSGIALQVPTDPQTSLAQRDEPENGANRDSIDGSDSMVEPALENRRSPELLSMNSVPFQRNGSISPVLPIEDEYPASTSAARVHLASLIDDQMEYLWKKQSIAPTELVDDDAWLERTIFALFDRPATPEDQRQFAEFVKQTRDEHGRGTARLGDDSARRYRWARLLTERPAFAELWGGRLAEHWLGKTTVSSEERRRGFRSRRPENDDQYSAFVGWFQKQVQAERPVSEIIFEIVGGAEELRVDDSEFEPSKFWWNEIASTKEPTMVAEKLVHSLLNGRASCSRCHDHQSDQSIPLVLSQPDYWGLAAFVAGAVDSKVDRPNTGGDRRLKGQSTSPSQDDPIYYERRDSTMALAVANLPRLKPKATSSVEGRENRSESNRSGEDLTKQSIESRRATFANWLKAQPQVDSSIANFVWRELFGSALVPIYPMADSDGLLERTDLAATLGNQFRNQQATLQEMVAWMVSSNTFSRSSVEASSAWYLTAGPSEASRYRTRQHLFAAFPTRVDRELSSLAGVTNWLDRTRAVNRTGEVLAQPLPRNDSAGIKGAPIQRSASDSIDLKPNQVEYIIRTEVLPGGLEMELDQLLGSNLGWTDLVNHAYLIVFDRNAQPDEIDLARRLLELTQDKRIALRRILAIGL